MLYTYYVIVLQNLDNNIVRNQNNKKENIIFIEMLVFSIAIYFEFDSVDVGVLIPV